MTQDKFIELERFKSDRLTVRDTPEARAAIGALQTAWASAWARGFEAGRMGAQEIVDEMLERLQRAIPEVNLQPHLDRIAAEMDAERAADEVRPDDAVLQ